MNMAPAPLMADGKKCDTPSIPEEISGDSAMSASASRCRARSGSPAWAAALASPAITFAWVPIRTKTSTTLLRTGYAATARHLSGADGTPAAARIADLASRNAVPDPCHRHLVGGGTPGRGEAAGPSLATRRFTPLISGDVDPSALVGL
jgi:hypothetical protein